MLGKIILWISAVVFIGYGIACWISPGLPAGFAGLEMTSGDAFAEIGAMYGGLQTGFGLFCLLAAVNADYRRAGLVLLAICIGLLGLARLSSALATPDPVGAYTWGALVYELATATIAGLALRR